MISFNVGIIKGYQSVKSGIADICLVSGIVADLSPMDIQGFYNMGAMGGRGFYGQPELACRPFDTQHEGFIYGQAGACIILESLQHARKREQTVLAEIKGTAINLDANSSSNPNCEGEEKAMRKAINQSGLSIFNIDYINTHGTSSPLGDRTEAEAIINFLGSNVNNVYVNATKGLTGHCLYSAGIVEMIATVLQIKEGFFHPNINLLEPIRREIKFCKDRSEDGIINAAISNSFGFGGINTSIVICKPT